MAYKGTISSLNKSTTSGRGVKSSGASTSVAPNREGSVEQQLAAGNLYNTQTGQKLSPTTASEKTARDTYLKSLNKKGSPNYVPTPDDVGFENMDQVNNDAIAAGMTLEQAQMKSQGITPPTQTTQPTTPGNTGIVSAAQPTPVQNKYMQGAAAASASGAQAPTTMGQAQSQGKQFMPPAEQDYSKVEETVAQYPEFSNILKTFSDYMSPKNQTQSLVSEYQALTKKSGLNSINADLINTQKIIEGTEDDIRAEVTAASGFATDSQVLAMASARNKSLIKNYNSLLATRDSIQQQLNTVISLSQQDRQLTQEKMNTQMNLAFKILDYRDKMVSGAKEGYNNIVNQLGYSGLYSSLKNNPYELSVAEKTMGLAPGQLSTLASQRDLDREYKIAQINSANRSNRDTGGGGVGTISGKPQNASQASANSYANRLAESNVILDAIGSKFTGKLSGIKSALPNIFKSGERQSYDQAQKNFVTAVLRRESGASISPSEFKTAKELYFPVAGDKPEQVLQKAQTRNTVINNFYNEANIARPVSPGQIVEENGVRYRVGADGETLEEI